MTADGAAANPALVNALCGYFQWCICHLLNLAIRDALPVRGPGQSIDDLPRASIAMLMVKQVCAQSPQRLPTVIVAQSQDLERLWCYRA
jgi:hypothetical protein